MRDWLFQSLFFRLFDLIKGFDMNDVSSVATAVAAKPAFNVVVPFNGVMTVQLNSLMAEKLIAFLDEFEDIDAELAAFRKALSGKNRVSWTSKDGVHTFSIDKLVSVTQVMFNNAMTQSLKSLIYEESQDSGEVDRFINALGKAMHNPVKAGEIRREKVRQRQYDDGDGTWESR